MAMMAASAVAVTLVVMVAVAVARAAVMASVARMATKVITVIFFGSDGATVEMGAAKAVAVTAVAVSHGGTGSRVAHGHSDGARAARNEDHSASWRGLSRTLREAHGKSSSV